MILIKTISYRILMIITSLIIISLDSEVKTKVLLINVVNTSVYYLHELAWKALTKESI